MNRFDFQLDHFDHLDSYQWFISENILHFTNLSKPWEHNDAVYSGCSLLLEKVKESTNIVKYKENILFNSHCTQELKLNFIVGSTFLLVHILHRIYFLITFDP
jgi:hypothetical protein